MLQAGPETRFESCGEIRRRREQAGLSRVQVARRLRWTTELVAQFERGSAIPSLLEATELAKLFDESARQRARNRRDANGYANDAVLTGADTSRIGGSRR